MNNRKYKLPFLHYGYNLLVASLLVLFIFTGGACCQTFVYNNNNCSGSITRKVGSRHFYYMKTGPYSGEFFSHNPSSTIITDNKYNGYNIQDFTIAGDTVFICGEDASGKGFYGWAKTTGPFSVSWKFNIYKLYDSESVYVTDVKRIRVFNSNGNQHVLLIGRYVDTTAHLYRNSIVHIKNNSQCYAAYSPVEHFDDIAVLDEYVVTIERKTAKDYISDPHYMRVLHKNNFSLYDTLFDYYSNWHYRRSIERIFLQTVGTNILVSIFNEDTAYYMNTYSVVNDTLQFHKCHIVHTDTVPTIQDVSYNDQTSEIIVLHGSDTSSIASVYSSSLFPILTWVSSAYPKINNALLSPYTSLNSVTPRSNTDFAITGTNHNKLVIWWKPVCSLAREHSMTGFFSSMRRAYGCTTRVPISIHSTTLSRSTGTESWGWDCSGK